MVQCSPRNDTILVSLIYEKINFIFMINCSECTNLRVILYEGKGSERCVNGKEEVVKRNALQREGSNG